MKTLKKYKTSRRLGVPIHEKAATEKFLMREARRSNRISARKHPRALSDYGRQLIEKQKVRFIYGILERQFRNYVRKAAEARGSAPAYLYTLLESRLDNVVYRLGLAPTRPSARQSIVHGHIFVGERRVKSPSYEVKKGDSIFVRNESRDRGVFQNIVLQKERPASPEWLLFDEKKFSGLVTGAPLLDEAREPFNLASVISFYSR